ncbi:hypothetical protein HNQ07_002374 [Deinococcus metalli]|uniref:DUF3187 family protein n=1 Tax=Deinococcus metalli TaxID=1141878 RepID=A0A7W8NQL1_9DEIO|nr:hypothetical protein [Deinococcus metalli]MBB5376910.1 hypothetical protein [Deinococcus metalli]GHF46254.1 hypothetical protein GCM10017781_23370 [Deinococcus metalli]
MQAARTVIRAGVVLTAVAAPAAQAQSTIFHLPANYMGRFGTSEIAYTTATGFGVRYIPLPTDPDVRLTVVKQANYWEINIGSRVDDTTLAGGVYFDGYTAPEGIPRMEYTHNPALGVQYSALIQGDGLHSHLSGGYAFKTLGDQVRVLAVAGVATQANTMAPYAQAEVAGGVGKTFGVVNTYAGATLRTSVFPAQGQVLGNVDVYLAASSSPLPGLSLAASHFERYVVGSVPLPDFGMSRYEESNLTALYRLPATGNLLSLGAVRARASRNWTAGYTYVWADVLLDVRGLPSLLGPGVGYQFGPNGADSRWLFTLVTLGR